MFTILLAVYAGIVVCSVIGLGLVTGPSMAADADRGAGRADEPISADDLAIMRMDDDGATAGPGAFDDQD